MTSMARASSRRTRTVISFRVSVPVLSVQMTVVEPRVSTGGQPAHQDAHPGHSLPTEGGEGMVATAKSPSGTAASASEMPTCSM